MLIRNQLFRTFVIMLCIAFLVFGLGGCNGSSDSSDDDSDAVEVDANAPESEKFAAAAQQVLLDAINKSEMLNSAQINLLFNPGAQLSDSQSNYTKSVTTLTNPAESSDSIIVSMESMLDTANGKAAMTAGIQSGSEVAQSGGIYFSDNTMLLKKADVEQPMIQHTIDASVAESFKELPAIERLKRILSDSSKPKLEEDQWSTAITDYLQTVTTSTEEANYAASEETVTMAATDISCTASTLSLSGATAFSVTRGLLALIAEDSSFKSYFNSQYYVSEEDLGVTGIDGMLRDLDALSAEAQAALTLSFKVLQGEKFSGMQVAAQTGEKAFTLDLMFYQDGYVKQNDIIFKSFDGSSIIMSEQNISEGGDKYAGKILYEDYAPGGVLQEHTDITTAGTITESSYTTTAQLVYKRAAAGDSSAIDISGTLDYSQEENSQGTNGSSTGAMTVTSEGESETINLSMTLEQLNSAKEITAPQFIATAGIATATQADLYAALGEDIDGEMFSLAPATMNTFLALILLFS